MIEAKTFKLSNGDSVAVLFFTDAVIVAMPDGQEHQFKNQERAAFWLKDILGINIYGD